MTENSTEVQSKVKRYNTQRSMNRPIYFYGLTGVQTAGVALSLLLLWLTLGNFGPALILLFIPFLRKNKKKLSEGDPNYFDTMLVKSSTRKHYQDTDRVIRKIGAKWLKD